MQGDRDDMGCEFNNQCCTNMYSMQEQSQCERENGSMVGRKMQKCYKRKKQKQCSVTFLRNH